jgi:hypothetical protein
MGDQADDRQFAVGRLLVAGEAGHGGGDLPPGLLALGPVELFGGDGDLAAGQLDPDLVGMGGQVVVPGRVPAAPAAQATISRLSSWPGNQPTGVWRWRPLLRPMVVRTRALNPRPGILPVRRIRFMTRCCIHRPIGPPVPG